MDDKTGPAADWSDKHALKRRLSPQQWRVTQEAATDPPYRNEFDEHFQPGRYDCVVCGAPLFDSDDKYDSGCGWPAFVAPAAEQAVATKRDVSHAMVRDEVVCKRCGAHLGHVFPDGPPQRGGMRYCINSSSLAFGSADESKPSGSA